MECTQEFGHPSDSIEGVIVNGKFDVLILLYFFLFAFYKVTVFWDVIKQYILVCLYFTIFL